MAKKPARRQLEGAKFLTPTFRASFMNVFEPKAFEDGDDEKYSVDMLWNKKKSDLSAFKKKIDELAVKAWGKDKAKWPKNYRPPFKDGDEKEDAEAYAGHVYAKADSTQPPGIYNEDKEDIINKREFVSGDFARASIYIQPYENVGGKGLEGRSGMKFYLQGIQRVKKGEPLGVTNSKNDFEVVENEEGESSDDTEDEEDGGF